MHIEKVKDECLKKVLVYKDKYQDYKQKVKRANQQITVLTQRVARYEVERGISAGALSSKHPSPGKGPMAAEYNQREDSEGQMDGYGNEDDDDVEEDESALL